MSDPKDSSLASVRTALFSGLLLLAPLVVTVWAFRKVTELLGGTISPLFLNLLPPRLQQLTLLWDILGTIVILVLVTLLGYLSRWVFGKYFLQRGERIIQGIPGIGQVYNTVKQIVDTFSTHNRNLFNKVVLVEFPREGIWSIGFLTNKYQGEPHALISPETWTVFVPTAPNPTSGFLLLLPKEKIRELDMSVGDGMKMIISGGGVVPPLPAAKEEKVSPTTP